MSDIINILWAVVWFAIFGGFLGLILAVSAAFFYVKTDPKLPLIIDALPGANCGACGYPGCVGLAKSIVDGTAPCNSCSVGGNDVAKRIANIMGTTTEKKARFRAQVMCSGTNDLAKLKYAYDGIRDCGAAAKLSGGPKMCPNGCVGLGTCVSACKFDAIHIINGVAAVDYNKCTACGLCVPACPKNIIALIPFEAKHWVGCKSQDRGSVTRTYCNVGCIACKLCEKVCPTGAITVNDYCATINFDLCSTCGKCEEVCPRKVIWSGISQQNDGIIRTEEDLQN